MYYIYIYICMYVCIAALVLTRATATDVWSPPRGIVWSDAAVTRRFSGLKQHQRNECLFVFF